MSGSVFLRKGLKMEAYKLLFLIVFPIGVTIVLTNPNVIPKLVNYYNYVEYPKQVDITKEQIEKNAEFSQIFQKKFEEEVKKLKMQQAAIEGGSGAADGSKS